MYQRGLFTSKPAASAAELIQGWKGGVRRKQHGLEGLEDAPPPVKRVNTMQSSMEPAADVYVEEDPPATEEENISRAVAVSSMTVW
jgi:hypothetical protein